jgi:carbon storage regulator
MLTSGGEVRVLVLTRKVGEAILIDDDIRITLVEIRGGTVRLGIAAPAEVVIDRPEMHARRKKSPRKGADPDDPLIV